MKLNRDKAWRISVMVVLIALLIGFALWNNNLTKLNKENSNKNTEEKEETEEVKDFYEDESFGEEKYEFAVADVTNIDIDVEYATVNIRTDDEATSVSVLTHIASGEESITCDLVGTTLILRHKGISDATSSSGSYIEIVMPPGLKLSDLVLSAKGGVSSIALISVFFEDIELTMGTGTIYADTLSAEDAVFICKGGLISVKTMNIESYKIKSSENGTVLVSTHGKTE